MTDAQPLKNDQPWKQGFVMMVAVAMLSCALAWWFSPQPFYMAWLAAVMLPWSVSIGCLTLMLIYCLTGGRWGEAAWPWLTIGARLMPLVALLFVPWMVGVATIYPWANSDVLKQFENTENRQWLFQVPFFIGRTVFYFAVWTLLAWMVMSRKSLPTNIIGGQPAAGLGLIAILLTVTWAGIDWVMSFDPFFTSTLFGALIGIGAMLAAMSTTVAAVCFWKPLHAASTDMKAIGDLSNLLLAFLMLWAYFSFAHFLIMWSGDLPNEAAFYAVRRAGVWGWIAPILSICGFIVPFLCLFSREFKRTPSKVGTLALCLLIVRMIELWWMVLPAVRGAKYAGLHWVTLPVTVLVLAIYLAALGWMMSSVSNRPALESIFPGKEAMTDG